MEALQRLHNRGSVSTGYNIDNSIKFEADNTEYLKWTDFSDNASDARKRTFSISLWCKRTELGVQQLIWNSGANGYLSFEAGDVIKWQQQYSTTAKTLNTNRLFRDTAAWYHIIVAVDSTQSTEANRVRLYVNGVEETSFSSATYPAEDATSDNVYGDYLSLGRSVAWGAGFCGYVADYLFVSEVQLVPTDVGEVDEDTGIWKPKAYSGTISTPSHFLEFQDGSDLGTATSGLDADTMNNIAAADQATDTPTNNFCVLSTLWQYAHGNTISEGSTKIYGAANDWGGGKASFGLTAGKWYWEIEQLAAGNTFMGLQTDGDSNIGSGNAQSHNISVVFYTDGTLQYSGGSETTTSASNSIGANSIVGFALDLDSGTQTIKIYLDGSLITSFGSSGTCNLSTYNIEDTTVFPFVALYDRTVNMNFGGYTVTSISSAQADANGYGTFEHAPPTGYYAVCTKNLSEFGG